MKLSQLHEAYITGPYAAPSTGLEKSQSHTGPEYRYQDKKFKKFEKPFAKKKKKRRRKLKDIAESTTTKFDPSDYDLLMSRLKKITDELGFKSRELGKTNKYPIQLFHSSKSGPNILIVSGMHGEEQACPWALLRYLETRPNLNCNLSFIPIVNPTGFVNDSRKNADGEVPNRGYVHQDDERYIDKNEKVEEKPTKEDKILIDHLGSLKKAGLDGFLALHEDDENDQYYVFAYGKKIDNGMTNALKNAGGESFGIVKKDDTPTDTSEAETKDGVVKNDHDGSLEDALFHMGVKHSYCSETPQGEDMEERIRANVAVIEAFISYICK